MIYLRVHVLVQRKFYNLLLISYLHLLVFADSDRLTIWKRNISRIILSHSNVIYCPEISDEFDYGLIRYT